MFGKNISKINNQIYNELGARWIHAKDDPVALLRAENRFRNPWILYELTKQKVPLGSPVLDMGCGAGFLSRDLAKAGFDVTAIDLSEGALEQARLQDPQVKIKYKRANILDTKENSEIYSACFLMDILEHIENPAQAFLEASRILKPGGLCFYYTFNRNFLSHLLVIKAVEFFVKNTPKDLHVYKYFLKPHEIEGYLNSAGLKKMKWQGIGPKILQPAMWTLVTTGQVRDDFKFQQTPNLWVGMMGVAQKCGPQ